MRNLKLILLLLICVIEGFSIKAEAEDRVVKPAEGSLLLREFKVDMALISRGLDGKGIPGSTDLQERLIQFFRNTGINLTTNEVNGSYAKLNPKQGVLTVKTTQKGIEAVQSALKILSVEPVRVMVQVRQFEVSHLGKDERLNTEVLLSSFRKDLLAITNAPWLGGNLKPNLFTNENVTFEGLFHPSHVHVLSPQEWKVVEHALELMDGVDMMAQPLRTTLNGQSFRCGLVCDPAKGVFIDAPSDGIFGRMEDMVLQAGIVISPLMRPQVDESGANIRLDWVADVIQIVNFQSQSPSAASLTPADTKVPNYRIRQITGSTMMKVGDTLMIGSGMAERTVKGRYGSPAQKQQVMTIFTLTASVVDEQGKPVKKAEK